MKQFLVVLVFCAGALADVSHLGYDYSPPQNPMILLQEEAVQCPEPAPCPAPPPAPKCPPPPPPCPKCAPPPPPPPPCPSCPVCEKQNPVGSIFLQQEQAPSDEYLPPQNEYLPPARRFLKKKF